MAHAYVVHAARSGKRKRTLCDTALAAVMLRERLLAEGWGVSIADALGQPVSDTRINQRASDEAKALPAP